MSAGALGGGFRDPVMDAQRVFRCTLMAMSRPGLAVDLPPLVAPPAPLSPPAAGLLCALADDGTRVHLDAPLAIREVRGWIEFQTGAAITDDPAEADFAVVADAAALPDFSLYRLGSDEYPERSTTVVVQIAGFDGTGRIALRGPGIDERVEIAPRSLPGDFAARLVRNRALFPRGIDLMLVTADRLLGLPRSARAEPVS